MILSLVSRLETFETYFKILKYLLESVKYLQYTYLLKGLILLFTLNSSIHKKYTK